jgi:two-component system, NarL family, response regulator YdfI
MIRVAIVAESPRLRSELSDVLRESGRFELIASMPITDAMETLDALPTSDSDLINAADVVLTDVSALPGLTSKGGEDMSPGVVLLSDDDEVPPPVRPLRTGLALLPTTATSDQILAAIEGVATGLMILHPDYAGSTGPSTVDDDPLTPREREVLHMLAAGLGNKEIANRLRISDHTAKFHVSQILAKLSAASRAEAVSIAMRRGLVPL